VSVSRRQRLGLRVSAATGRLDRHRLALGVGVAAVGLFLAYIAAVSVTGPPFQERYRVTVTVPRDAPILRKGDAVRVAGRLAGFVTAVEPDPDQRAVSVEANLRPEFAPLGSDASANVRVKSIVYMTYLELIPGNTDDPLPDGGEIPVERVSSGVDLLEVVQLFDEQARDSLRRSLVITGYGVAGRGGGLNDALATLPSSTADLASQLEAATRTEGALAGIVSDGARVAAGARGERSDDVAALLDSAGEVLGTTAGRPTELAAAIRLLPAFEEEFLRVAPRADPLLADSARLAGELTPSLRELNEALPAVAGLLGLGSELRTETLAISAVTDPVLRAQRPLFRALYPTAASLDPLFADLEEVVDTLAPYEEDIAAGGEALAAATENFYPQGQTAPDNPALRYTPILTCHRARNPFPDPGEARQDSASC
jgi:phospholipid/cholesterol/gamma-HCH transport system substrate-binding protein